MTTILFSHGKFSHPNSTKINFLTEIAQELGCTSHSIDYTSSIDPEERVELLKAQVALYKNKPLILVGSSMGAYVATAVASETPVLGLFLMAPAFYLQGYAQQSFQPKTEQIELIHGWQDETVSYEQSIEFGRKHTARLHLVNDNHRLSTSHTFLKATFRAFLENILNEGAR